jgi:hypothetical protein
MAVVKVGQREKISVVQKAVAMVVLLVVLTLE